MAKYTPQQRIEVFWSRVAIDETDFACWEWMARIERSGYGKTVWEGKPKKSHRIAYMLAFGEFDQRLFVCHHCDNPACVNPNHLFLGTRSDNMKDMIQKGRHLEGQKRRIATHKAKGKTKGGWKLKGMDYVKGEQNGAHKLTEQQVLEIRAKYVRGVYGYMKLSTEYGVDPITIKAIVTQRTWKHI